MNSNACLLAQNTSRSSRCHWMPRKFILSTGHLSLRTWVSFDMLTEVYCLPTGFGFKTHWEFVHPAAHVGGRYILSGEGDMALNMTHPSPLEDDRVEYHLHLTPDLLPEMEELFLPGPLQQEINIQVKRQIVCVKMIYFTTNVCKNVIVDTLGCKKRKKHLSFRIRKKKGQTVVILFFTGLSKIWQRIWREDKSKHRLSFLCTCKTQRHYAERQMGCRHSCLLCLLWIRSVTVNDDCDCENTSRGWTPDSGWMQNYLSVQL